MLSGSLETPGKSLLSAAKKKKDKKKRRLLDINSPPVLWGFVLPVQAEILHDDPDGPFNEMFP